MKAFVIQCALLLLAISTNACSGTLRAEDTVVTELKKQLYDKDANIRPALRYPQSVMRFYRLNDHTPVWLSNDGQSTAAQAMVLLDCVLAYGLSPKDYHPRELTYTILQALGDKPDTLSLATKIRFEVMLTDAMITLVNHLHFGKLIRITVVTALTQL